MRAGSRSCPRVTASRVHLFWHNQLRACHRDGAPGGPGDGARRPRPSPSTHPQGNTSRPGGPGTSSSRTTAPSSATRSGHRTWSRESPRSTTSLWRVSVPAATLGWNRGGRDSAQQPPGSGPLGLCVWDQQLPGARLGGAGFASPWELVSGCFRLPGGLRAAAQGWRPQTCLGHSGSGGQSPARDSRLAGGQLALTRVSPQSLWVGTLSFREPLSPLERALRGLGPAVVSFHPQQGWGQQAQHSRPRRLAELDELGPLRTVWPRPHPAPVRGRPGPGEGLLSQAGLPVGSLFPPWNLALPWGQPRTQAGWGAGK